MIGYNFLTECVKDGLAHSYDTQTGKWVKPYPEVTGYILSYFSQRGLEYNLCGQIANKLVSIQRNDGGWATFTGNQSFFFDTIQIAHGLLDYYLASGDTSVLESIERALQFLSNSIWFGRALSSSDRLRSIPGMQSFFGWAHGDTPINTKIFEIDGKAQKVVPTFSLEPLVRWALRAKQIPFTHPGGYQIEGFLAMQAVDLVQDRLRRYFLSSLDQFARLPYGPGLQYEYNSGSVQIGILMFKCGMSSQAEAILSANLEKVSQRTFGGLPQFSAIVEGAELPHYEVNSWGTKYLLELQELVA